jgi:hypothetical protein
VESANPEPQHVQFQAEAACGGSQEFGADWIAYALNTEAPSFVGGVDPTLNPQLGGGQDDGTAYA